MSAAVSPWLALTRADIGVCEIKGAKQHPKIIGYRASAGCSWVSGTEEAVPWCAIAVNAWLERCQIRGTRSPAAKRFCDSKHFVELAGPAPGAIVVIERNPPHASYGHVGLCDGANANRVWLTGGNQGDAVNTSSFPRDRVCGYYWPATLPLPKIGDFAAPAKTVAGGKVA